MKVLIPVKCKDRLPDKEGHQYIVSTKTGYIFPLFFIKEVWIETGIECWYEPKEVDCDQNLQQEIDKLKSELNYNTRYLKAYMESSKLEAIEFQKYLDRLYAISHLYEVENKTLEDLYASFKQERDKLINQ